MLRFPFVSFPEDDKGRSDFPWFHDHGRGGTSSIIELGRINHHLWFYQSQFSKHTKCIDPLIGALSSFYGLLPIIQLWCLEISICVAVIFCKWAFLGNPWKGQKPNNCQSYLVWFPILKPSPGARRPRPRLLCPRSRVEGPRRSSRLSGTPGHLCWSCCMSGWWTIKCKIWVFF